MILAVLGIVLSSTVAHARCGKVTHLADVCANAFPTSQENFYPWDSDKFKSAGVTLTPSTCPKLRVFSIHDRFAKIGCRKKEYWINLDSLSCEAHNTKAYLPVMDVYNCEPCFFRKYPEAAALGDQGWRLYRQQKDISAALGKKIVAKARETAAWVQKNIAEDRATISRHYAHLSLREVSKHFDQSVKNLKKLYQRAQKHLGPNCSGDKSGLDPNALIRARAACILIAQSLDAAKFFQSTFERPFGTEANWQKSFAENGNYWQAWGSFMSNFGHNQSNYDDLVIRMVMFEGLPAKERDKMMAFKRGHHGKMGELIFYQRMQEFSGPGEKAPILLHNGYIFGGARQGDSGVSVRPYDCSDFVSTVFRGDRHSLAPTTVAFKNIALAVQGKKVPLSPETKPWAECFEPVDLRRGEEPQPGDIVVSRELNGDGHIVVVDSYDPTTRKVRTIEATGGGRNTVGEFSRPIFEKTCQGYSATAIPPVRSDIDILRIKADPGKACPFKMDIK